MISLKMVCGIASLYISQYSTNDYYCCMHALVLLHLSLYTCIVKF